MKLGIISDSHDELNKLKKAMLEFKRRGAEAIIHAGDFVAPFTIEVLKLGGCPVYAVYGNCDGERFGLKDKFKEIGEINTEPHIYELGELKVVVMHQPKWVDAFSQGDYADLVVFGHLHQLYVENRPPWIINPGEIFGNRSNEGSTAVWFDSDRNEAEVIYLDKLKDIG